MCTCATHGRPCSRTRREEGKNGVYQQEEHCLPWNGVHWVGRRSVWPWQSWCLHIAHAQIATYHTDLLRCQLGTVTFRCRNDSVLWFHIQPPLYDTYRKKTEKNTAHSWALLWGEPTHARWDMRIHWTQQHHNPGIIHVGRLFARWEARPFHEAMGAEPYPGVLHTENLLHYTTQCSYIKKPPKYVISIPSRNLARCAETHIHSRRRFEHRMKFWFLIAHPPPTNLTIFQTKQTWQETINSRLRHMLHCKKD